MEIDKLYVYDGNHVHTLYILSNEDSINQARERQREKPNE